jgi:lipopolysaccharide exporter
MSVSKAKTFRNLIYTVLTKGVTLVCIGVTSSVVARNLSPSDYGVIGFANIIIMFLLHFSDVGTFNGAIRRPQLDRQGLRTAFTLKVLLSSGAFVTCYLIAPFAHHFFEHPATGNIIRVLAFNFLLTTIGFMPQVELTREQNFRALMVPGIAGIVVRCILAVTLIFLGWKYWAVVLADVGATLVSSIAMQLTRRVPLGFHLDSEDTKAYLRFGIPLLGSGILAFLILNLDNLLVGSRMGSARLGYYALAFTWGSFVCGLLNDTVNNVLYPAYSAIQNDLKALRRWYLKTVDLAAFLAMVANTAILANAHYFLVTFLGKGTDKWLPAEIALKILCIYGIARAMIDTLGTCMTVLGGTRQLLFGSAVAGAVEITLLLISVHTGRIELVAAAVLFAYLCQLFVFLPFLRRTFALSARNLVAQLWPVIPAVAGSYLITAYLPDSFGHSLFTLGCRGLFSAVVAALIHGLLTKFRCFQEALGMIMPMLAPPRLELRESPSR